MTTMEQQHDNTILKLLKNHAHGQSHGDSDVNVESDVMLSSQSRAEQANLIRFQEAINEV